jgi:hypothetical protein
MLMMFRSHATHWSCVLDKEPLSVCESALACCIYLSASIYLHRIYL